MAAESNAQQLAMQRTQPTIILKPIILPSWTALSREPYGAFLARGAEVFTVLNPGWTRQPGLLGWVHA